MKLLAIAGNIDALIAEIRLRTPLQALADRTGWTLKLRSFHDCRRADLDAADVLIVQRGASRRAWRLQQSMRLRGGAVICEIDDLLTELPAHISNHAAVLGQTAWVQRCLQTADVVTVSTRRLGEALGLPQARVVPNHALPLGDVPLPEPDPTQPVSLIFASMERLATDFIYPPLRAVQGSGVQVVVMGPPGQAFLDAGVAAQCQPLLPRHRFIEFVRQLPNPVAVIPLEASRFASCKSAIKWFEYAEVGIPVLCSAVSPYLDVVQDGSTGALVANEVQAWQEALQRAIADSAWRQRVAHAARVQVRAHHTLEHSVAAWQSAIEAALQERQQAGHLTPGVMWRLQQTTLGAFEGLSLALRQRNRARLARRQGP
jgi:hypothetical protein